MNDPTTLLCYTAALDAVPASLAVLDQRGFIVAVNQAWKQLMTNNGLTLTDNGIGTNYLRFFEDSVVAEALDAARGLRQVLSGERETYLQVYPCHTPDQAHWFQLRAARFPDAPLVMVIHEDVTDCKQVEYEFQQQMGFVRGLVDSSPDCIRVLSLDGAVLWMNEVGQALMEIDALESVQGKPWASLWPQEVRQHLIQALDAARRGEQGRFQGGCPTAKGTMKFWDVVVTPVFDAHDQPASLLVTSRDLTALQAAQERILYQAQETTRILNSIREAFYALDQDWRFTYLNPQAEVLLQRPAPELLGQCLWEAFPETLQGSFPQQYRAARQEQRHICFQEYFAPLSGWFEINAYPHGQGLAVYFQNITARKAEEQAQQERSAILEMMVQGRPLSELLHHIALMVERQFPGHACTIMLEQEGVLNLAAAPGLPEEFHPVLSGLEVREGAGVCGTAAALRERVVVEDLLTHPDCLVYLRRLPPNNLRACVSLPMLDGSGVVLGALALYATTPGSFSDQTLRVLDKARHLAAAATEHHHLTQQLVHQANHDALTGLANRQLYETNLREALQISEQLGLPVSLLFIDIDDFKSVNDSLGHHVGDEVLRILGQRLKKSIRPEDTLARISGDEFTVVMPSADEAAAQEAARRILEALVPPLVLPERKIEITASIGISVSSQGHHNAATMQQRADFAMYEAKSQRTGVCVFHLALADRASRRFELGRYLRRATELRELELYYQPLVNLGSGQVIGAEALLRWHHPQLGLVSPAEFIPVAEETGMIVPIGEWVLREACRQGAAWLKQGHPPRRLAINVSALQFERPAFVGTVAACLRDTGFPAQDLELELTERVVMRDAEESIGRMRQLRALGVSISVDDFGTGYSSLSYLSRLPLNVLKIDRSFVSQLNLTVPASPVVKAIIMLAQSLGLETVAEGVETQEELGLLRELGCHLGQGYLFARPLPATDPFWHRGGGTFSSLPLE